jgi:flagellar biosynthesis GTPase FlhF
MSEVFAESVTSEAPVSVTPELLNKPVRADEQQQGNADAELLKTKLNLANQHAKQAKKEAEEAKQRMADLEDQIKRMQEQQQATVQKSLEDQGQFKELYQQERQRNKDLEARYLSETAELKSQLEGERQGRQQESLRAAALGKISQANAVNPQQLYALLQTRLRTDDEGSPVVLDGGVEQPLGDYLANLKQSAEWQHHFSANSARGMGSAPTATVAPGMENPYKTKNLTAALQLEVANPELAKALKAEAARG